MQFYTIFFVIAKFFFQRTSNNASEICSEQPQPEQ